MSNPSPSGRRRIPASLKHPAVLCVFTASLLVAIGDRYPFSPFPMYSNIDGRAEVLYLTNESDAPLPLSDLFGHGSAQLKKRYETNLEEIAGTKDYDRATPEQLNQAGREFLDRLVAGMTEKQKRKLREKYRPEILRLWVLSLDSTHGDFEESRTALAEKPVVLTP